MPDLTPTIPVRFQGQATGLVSASRTAQKSFKDLQRELNITRKDVAANESRFKSFGRELDGQRTVLSNYSKGLENLQSKFLPIVTATAAVGAATTGLVASYVNAVREVDLFSQRLGVSTEKMSRYGNMARFVNSDLDNVVESIAELAVRVNEGGENIEEALNRVGLSINDLRGLNPDEMFDRFTRAAQGTSDTVEVTAAVMDIMGDEAQRLIPLMRGTAEEIERIANAGPIFTAEDAKNVRELSIAWQEFLGNIQTIGFFIADLLAPAVTSLLNAANSLLDPIKEWIRSNKELDETIKKVNKSTREGFTVTQELTNTYDAHIDTMEEWASLNSNVRAELARLEFIQDEYTKSVAENTEVLGAQNEALAEQDAKLRLVGQAYSVAAQAAGAYGDAASAILSSFSGPGGAFSPLSFLSNAAQVAQANFIGPSRGASLGAGFGGLLGAASAFIPGVGLPIASTLSALGGVGGGFLGDIFGGGQDQAQVAFDSYFPGSFDIGRGRFGQRSVIASSDIGQISIGGRDGGGREPWMQRAVDAIARLDNRIAESLSPEQLASAQFRAAQVSNETRAGGFDLAENIRIRTSEILNSIGGDIEDVFDRLTEDASLSAAELLGLTETLLDLYDTVQEGKVFESLPEDLSGLVETLEEFAIEGENLDETYNRLVLQAETFRNSLFLIGKDFDGALVEAADAVIELAGGISRFAQQSQFFFSEFFTPEEQQAMQLDLANREIDEFIDEMQELGFEFENSRQGFKEFVLGLDLSTEAGREAYAAALDVADAFDHVADAAEAAFDFQLQPQKPLNELVFGQFLDDNTSAIIKLTGAIEQNTQVVRTGLTPSEGGSRFANRVLNSLIGGVIGGSLTDQLLIDQNRIQTEMSAIVEQLLDRGIYRTPGSRQGSFNQRSSLTVAWDELNSSLLGITGQLNAIARLEAQFPGLGEERFALMQRFAPLFDGTELTDLERTLGFEAFRREWEQIMERVSDSVIGSTQEAGDTISDYLNSILLGDLSSLTPTEQVALAQSNFDTLISRVRSGENVDAQELTSAHAALANELRSHFGVGPDFVAAFNNATSDLISVGQELASSANNDIALNQLEELKKLVGIMREVRNSVASNAVGVIGGGL